MTNVIEFPRKGSPQAANDQPEETWSVTDPIVGTQREGERIADDLIELARNTGCGGDFTAGQIKWAQTVVGFASTHLKHQLNAVPKDSLDLDDMVRRLIDDRRGPPSPRAA